MAPCLDRFLRYVSAKKKKCLIICYNGTGVEQGASLLLGDDSFIMYAQVASLNESSIILQLLEWDDKTDPKCNISYYCGRAKRGRYLISNRHKKTYNGHGKTQK